jgi:hypothetical protein
VALKQKTATKEFNTSLIFWQKVAIKASRINDIQNQLLDSNVAGTAIRLTTITFKQWLS